MNVGSFTKWVTLTVALGAASCGSDNSTTSTTSPYVDTDASQGQTIDFASYIGTVPGGAQSLQAMFDVNKKMHPEDTVTYSEVEYTDVPGDVAKRIAAGNPPDVVMHHASQLVAFLDRNGPNSLYPLNDFLALPAEAAILPNIYPEMIADVTIGGKIYALPQQVVSLNPIVYGKALFAAHNVNPPTNLDEFLTACKTFKAAGVNPIALFGYTYLLQDVTAAVMGVDAYASYLKGGDPDKDQIRKAIGVFAEVMDNYVDLDLGGIANGQPSMVSGKSAMYVSGDWAEGGLASMGWTAGVDFTITVFPGTEGLYPYTLEVLSVLDGTPNLRAALNFMDSSLSLEGLTVYNKQGHQTPPRTDVDASEFSSERRFMIEYMKTAKYRIAVNPGLIWEAPSEAFLASTPRDTEALLQTMLTTR